MATLSLDYVNLDKSSDFCLVKVSISEVSLVFKSFNSN